MKELKVYVPQDGPYGLEPEEGGEPVEEETCYLKSDVDKVIAELKKKQGTAEKLLNNALYCISNGKKHMMSLARKKNHADYKRCLAMAAMCAKEVESLECLVYGVEGAFEKYTLYKKWRQRWLELAEKFKEDK